MNTALHHPVALFLSLPVLGAALGAIWELARGTRA